MSWVSILDSVNPGTGSEGGTIVIDEEHQHGARITLEQGAGRVPYAITCGIYGSMVHTRFFGDRDTAFAAMDPMKRDLAALLDQLPDKAGFEAWQESGAYGVYLEALSAFVDRYPT